MLIEASSPLTVRLRSGEVNLTPGRPVEFSEKEGLQLLEKARGKVRMIPRQPVDWLLEWRHLAAITAGFEAGDPRLGSVFSALEVCDSAFIAGDYPAFTRAVLKVEEAVKSR
jgi:hypothetical protein